MKETILFLSKKEALTVFKMLEKEWDNLKWDGCNGIYLETEEIEAEEEEMSIYDVTHSIAFKTVIELEKAEYCLNLSSCKLCCSVQPNMFEYQEPFVMEVLDRLSPFLLYGRKAGSSEK